MNNIVFILTDVCAAEPREGYKGSRIIEIRLVRIAVITELNVKRLVYINCEWYLGGFRVR